MATYSHCQYEAQKSSLNGAHTNESEGRGYGNTMISKSVLIAPSPTFSPPSPSSEKEEKSVADDLSSSSPLGMDMNTCTWEEVMQRSDKSLMNEGDTMDEDEEMDDLQQTYKGEEGHEENTSATLPEREDKNTTRIQPELKPWDNVQSETDLNCASYVEDIMSHHYSKEMARCKLLRNGLEECEQWRCLGITNELRRRGVDWMVQLHHLLRLSDASLFLGIAIMDKYLQTLTPTWTSEQSFDQGTSASASATCQHKKKQSKTNRRKDACFKQINANCFPLFVLCCLWIASKYQETFTLEYKHLFWAANVRLNDNDDYDSNAFDDAANCNANINKTKNKKQETEHLFRFTRENLIQMEEHILLCLDFNVCLVTHWSFLERYLHIAKYRMSNRNNDLLMTHLCMFLAEMCCADSSIALHFPPSMVFQCDHLLCLLHHACMRLHPRMGYTYDHVFRNEVSVAPTSTYYDATPSYFEY
ncbi:hypothetical protein RFI_23012 [Reticulomyxa filosa]|uniref:Cyclin N-terminal domain-containing protein n=1 Tax=Reticulomyxa filosa TaxID=46433 RepID=X6ML57_RETFI|nr:hypothetical protein RFI_23012 [Reticulomyxa filosa]|eukprot:ETO14356.1 hypothetical protein RFI_23012 [Reticulomyxa filosa]